jgi:hypothetical protein
MSLFGKILSVPFGIINIPLKLADKVITLGKDEKVLSAPLDMVADEISKLGDRE